ncbi:MAG: helix-turn-helix domain-containing protein, partial [Treponema sp.]|nr:helix-turn-helix domain-containing protein [Treponema sp.]
MFNKNLKYYRLKKNMSKKDLAEACGVTPMAITNYEQGTRRPEIEIINKMAKALDVGVADFIIARNENLMFVHGPFRKNSALAKSQQEYVKEAVEEYFGRFFEAVDYLGG